MLKSFMTRLMSMQNARFDPIKKIVNICKPSNLNKYEYPLGNEPIEDDQEAIKECSVFLAYRPAYARKDFVNLIMGEEIAALIRNRKSIAHWRVILQFKQLSYACELYTASLNGGSIESKFFAIDQENDPEWDYSFLGQIKTSTQEIKNAIDNHDLTGEIYSLNGPNCQCWAKHFLKQLDPQLEIKAKEECQNRIGFLVDIEGKCLKCREMSFVHLHLLFPSNSSSTQGA